MQEEVDVIESEMEQEGDLNVSAEPEIEIKTAKPKIKRFISFVVKNANIFYFAFLTLICLVTLITFFLSLDKFGPTIASATFSGALLLFLFTVYLEKKATEKKKFLHFTNVVLFLTVVIIFLTNIIKFL